MKKGFTLIELLAVIVIIAIIALIATPIILGVVENARKSAAGSSALGYIDAVEKEIALDGLDDIVYPVGRIDIIAEEPYNQIQVQGSSPTSGILNIRDDYVIEQASLCINGYHVELTGHKVSSITKGGCEDLAIVYHDASGAAVPKLKDGLIPVIIAEDGTVTKADVSKKWYDYDHQWWANAVILNGEDTKDPGDEISEDEIKAYFVWIPKYRYKLFNVEKYTSLTTGASKAQSIEIEFNRVNTIDNDTECVTPLSTGATGTCENDKWMTHPAFISFDVDGLWVAKFETSGTDSEILIKPNQISKYEKTLAIMFEKAYNYNRELDSHMMKNTEWGAVAYLAHSKYGINKEVGFNNYNEGERGGKLMTGCGAEPNASVSATCTPYNTASGKLASTTGNITGIYDMNGGASEIAAAMVFGKQGTYMGDITKIANYGTKYYDIYANILSDATNFSGRILGDATGEMGPFNNKYQNSWYQDKSWFISESTVFFRGGTTCPSCDAKGMFVFWYPYGGSFDWFSYRIVLGF